MPVYNMQTFLHNRDKYVILKFETQIGMAIFPFKLNAPCLRCFELWILAWPKNTHEHDKHYKVFIATTKC